MRTLMARVAALLVLGALCAAMAPRAIAQPAPPTARPAWGAGWIPLGTATLQAPGQVTLQLPNETRPPTKAIRLVAADGAVEISRIVVVYANGQQHFVEDPLGLASGADSVALAERDEPLIVDRIVVTGRVGGGRPVRIEVWGQREVTARPRAAIAAGDAKGYRELAVLYGTTRKREATDREKAGSKLAAFTGTEGGAMTLGRAYVTIPIEREIGSIPRPDFNFVFRVQFRAEDPRRDFTLAAVDVLGEREFMAEVRSQAQRDKTRFRNQALVFVHGYNVSFDDAIFRTAQIAHDIGFDGAAVTFSWPSRGAWTSYRHDLDASRGARDHLRRLLEMIAADPAITAVNLVAHSMGNAPVTEVLGSIGEINRAVTRAGGRPTELKLREVVLAAPDVSRTVFEQLAGKFGRIARGGITLYASGSDKAMLISKTYAGLDRAGDVPRGGPLVVGGIETIDVTKASTALFGSNHAHFADRAPLVDDMRIMIEKSVHPPSARFPKTFRPVGSSAQQYWEYQEQP